MSENPATPGTAMPEPSPDQNAAGETSPSSGWWSRFHSPTDPDHDETVTDETDPADDVALPDAPTSAPPRAVWPEGWAVVPPVGSIVTDVGVTFSLAPASPTDRPMRVRCTSCDWDKTAPQPQAVDAVRVHALRHIADPRPRIAHLPSWLQPRLKGRR
ncbi:hypothetical protein LWF15_15900 [Kineosporia rhizophila]|uniref:hypothetical protein n=1 Tax=Kineosporia rhizophila TaxID=84633 RepID=UPI001E4B641E|nr:hypothetical protein [Kineosporia rhizophila]MCE0536986.1 hypothetical protein [Kineosporia rhizophila]